MGHQVESTSIYKHTFTCTKCASQFITDSPFKLAYPPTDWIEIKRLSGKRKLNTHYLCAKCHVQYAHFIIKGI